MNASYPISSGGFRTRLIQSLLLGSLCLLVQLRVLAAGLEPPSAAGADTGEAEFVSDLEHRFLLETQGWGVLGMDCAASEAGRTTRPLEISGRRYEKGLGAHAQSEIVISLGGEYEAFEADIGLQDGQPGSVGFQVFADGALRFDSGAMRQSNPARSIRVDVRGADELRLKVSDVGDGIAHDCANWANARLLRGSDVDSIGTNMSVGLSRDHGTSSPAARLRFDAAPFARVMSWDPHSTAGARADRLEEFPVDELYPGRELSREPNGSYAVGTRGGLAAVGLEWLERRRIQRLELEVVGAATPAAEDVRVQYWINPMEGVTPGSTSWQGAWAPLKGRVERLGSRYIFQADWRGNRDARMGTYKVRWLLPGKSAVRVASPVALTDSRPVESEFLLEADPEVANGVATIGIYNGSLAGNGDATETVRWNLPQARSLRVIHTKTRTFKADRTVLRVQTPQLAFGVSVEDLLTSGCVYVPDAGVFISYKPAARSLAEYRPEIASRTSILARVRQMPDQTLSSAFRKVHRPEADAGPTLLSLACGNSKFIAERNGTVQFSGLAEPSPLYGVEGGNFYPWRLVPVVADGRASSVTRELEEGWMPVPVLTSRDGDIVYRQRTFVAPFDEPTTSSGLADWFHRKAGCVLAISAENLGSQPAKASVGLRLEQTTALEVLRSEPAANIAAWRTDGRLLAWARVGAPASLRLTSSPTAWGCEGELRAGERAEVMVVLPGWDAAPAELAEEVTTDLLLGRTKAHWNNLFASSMQVSVPDPFVTNLIKASQVHCFLAARNEGGKTVAPWIASTFYGPLESEAQSVIRGMQYLGQRDFARRSHEYYLQRYNPRGFLTTGYTTMGTGWHLWCLGEYFALTRDTGLLADHLQTLRRACWWIEQESAKTRVRDPHGNPVPEFGLMPPGVLADWNAYAYYFYSNGYYAAGLDVLARALAHMGDSEAERVQAQAKSFREAVLAAYQRVRSLAPVNALRSGAWVPAYPTQALAPFPTGDLHPGQDVGRSWAYDVELGAHHLIALGVLDARSREAGWIIDHMEDIQFLLSGWHSYPAEESERDWFNLGGFAKMQPYYARTGEVHALRDDVKPFLRTWCNSIPSLLNREDLSFWEHFFNGAFNKTHETGYFLYQTRLMFLMERGDELWIAPFVTTDWMKDGQTVRVRNAPSQFGPLSYELKSQVGEGRMTAEIDLPAERTPSGVVLRLRHPEGKPIRTVRVNGAEHSDFDSANELIRLPRGVAGHVSVQAEW